MAGFRHDLWVAEFMLMVLETEKSTRDASRKLQNIKPVLLTPVTVLNLPISDPLASF